MIFNQICADGMFDHPITAVYVCTSAKRARDGGGRQSLGQSRTAYPEGTPLPAFDASHLNNARRKEVEAK